jgi:hypothetical protein
MTKGNAVQYVAAFAVAVLLTATLGFAHSRSAKVPTKGTSITLVDATRLPNGERLQPGVYEVRVPENSQSPEVAFYKDGQLVAKATAKVVSQPEKNPPDTAVETTQDGNNQLLNSILPGGWREKLIFSGSAGETSGGGR